MVYLIPCRDNEIAIVRKKIVSVIEMNILPLFSFLAGFASILSPCILPLIPVFIGYFLAKKKKIEIFSFILGLFSIFLIFIILTMVFTAAINHYLYYIRIIASLILITLGTAILFNKNILNISPPHYNLDSGKNQDDNNENILKLIKSSFITGSLTSLAWAPCYGTYLISLISFSVATENTFYSGVNLLIYTLGFGLSLFIIGFLISAINIQKLINKADLINKISGILIILGGIYLLWIQFFGY
ncbi:MAG: cytochrome c biogenesis CcdA family protein [Methanobrevibacter sp.]|nr:cytochrome c biogenesis CcdA family protein [Methanobrevibacter sp.]